MKKFTFNRLTSLFLPSCKKVYYLNYLYLVRSSFQMICLYICLIYIILPCNTQLCTIKNVKLQSLGVVFYLLGIPFHIILISAPTSLLHMTLSYYRPAFRITNNNQPDEIRIDSIPITIKKKKLLHSYEMFFLHTLFIIFFYIFNNQNKIKNQLKFKYVGIH